MILLLIACATPPEVADVAPAEPSVAWIAPRRADRQVLVTLPAEIESAPDAVHTLGPRLPSRLVQWHVQPGDVVAAGDRLATVDSASLGGLAATVDARRRARDAQQDRLDVGVGTRAEVAQAEADLAEPAARLAATRGTLRGDVWTSPVAGTVASLGCPQGAEVGPSDPCVTLVDPSRVRVLVRVPERHLARLDAATARWIGADGRVADDLPLHSREPAADRATRTVALRFSVANTPLVPHTSGRADVIVAANAWAVPRDAVTSMEGEPVVFLRQDDGAKPVPVEVIGRHADDLLIEADLPDGAEVAWRGVFQLKSQALLEEEEE